jgi:hypothetical protein
VNIEDSKAESSHWLAVRTMENGVDGLDSSTPGELLIDTSSGLSFSYHTYGALLGGHLIVFSPCCRQRMFNLTDGGSLCSSCDTKYAYPDRHILNASDTSFEAKVDSTSKLRVIGWEDLVVISENNELVLFLTAWLENLINPLNAVIEADMLTSLLEKIELESYIAATIRQANAWIKKHQRVTLMHVSEV